jgi:nitrogen regulatory protein PII
MKLITAIVRPEKLDELIQALIGQGVRGLTVTDVRGFGQQYGRLAGAATRVTGRPGEHMAVLLAKIRLDLVALDDDAETIVEAIAKHARAEAIGDGKIWVTPIDSALRVRTGERDRAAVLCQAGRPWGPAGTEQACSVPVCISEAGAQPSYLPRMMTTGQGA